MRARDQLVEHEPPFEVLLDEPREVALRHGRRRSSSGRCASRPSASPSGTRPPALTLILPSHTTWPPGRTASTDEAERRLVAGGLEHVVGAAAAGQRADLRRATSSAGRVDRVRSRRTGARASQPRRADVDGDDACRRRRAARPAARSGRPRRSRSRATLAPGSTCALRTAAPTPVITPQPMMQARSNGISFGTAIAPDSGTTVYSACVDVVEEVVHRRRRRGVRRDAAVEQQAARLVAA